MPSSAQNVPLVRVYDYLMTPTGPASGNAAPRAGRTVTVTLSPSIYAGASAPAVQIPPGQVAQSTVTDGNGYWEVWIVPTDNITPAGMLYLVDDGYQTYKIKAPLAGIPANGWQSSAQVVTAAPQLTPAGQTVGALTVTGLLTAQAGVSITAGGLTVVGATTMAALTASGLITGSAGLSITAGAVTLPAASIADAALSANIARLNAANVFSAAGNSFSSGLSVSAGLTVASAGFAVTGNSTLAGSLTLSGANNLLVAVNQGLDTSVGGQLVLGPTNATTIAMRGPQKSPIVGRALTALGAGAQTLTAALLVGGTIEHTVTAAVADTTDTGANLDAAIANVANGDTFDCYLTILGAFTVTLTAAAGVTIKGTTALLGTAAGKTAHLIFRRTAASTWTCYVVFSS